MDGWVDGWMDGWMDGWVGVKAGLRIAYSNQKSLMSLIQRIFICINSMMNVGVFFHIDHV